MLMSLTCVWAAVHYWLASRTLRNDLATLYVPPATATAVPTSAAEM
jgi:hypothetical protein